MMQLRDRLICAVVWCIMGVSSFHVHSFCSLLRYRPRSAQVFVINKKSFAPDPLGDVVNLEKKARYNYIMQHHEEYGIPMPEKDFEDDEEPDDDLDDDEEMDDDSVLYTDTNIDPLERLGDQEGDFKSGFVTIVGNPNVGKSSLLNSLLKEKLSIVTNKPQTTRQPIIGILSDASYQLVFTDTPGMLKEPGYKLQKSMQQTIRFSTRPDDADVILLLTDVYGEELYDPEIMKRLRRSKVPVIVAINKIDVLRGHRTLNVQEKIYRPPPLLPAPITTSTDKLSTESSVLDGVDENGVVLTLKERLLRRKRSKDYAEAIKLNPASSSMPSASASAASTTLSTTPIADKSLDYTDDDGDSTQSDSHSGDNGVDIRDVEWKPKKPNPLWGPLVPGAEGLYDSLENKAWGSGGRDDSIRVMGVDESIGIWKARLPNAEIIPISATRGVGLSELVDLILSHCEQGPRWYRSSTLTDKSERFCCAEKIRETIFTQYQEEIPYSTEVMITEFRDVNSKLTAIEATIIVNKDSHQAIIIGREGQKIKELGTLSRIKLEEFLNRRVYLTLKVKLHKNWKNDENALKKYGYIDE